MKVELYKYKDYDAEKIKKALANYAVPGNKVLVKINCLFDAKPEKCVTTHPKVVEAVVKWLKEKGVECHVGDSPGAGGFKRNSAGFVELCEREQIPLVELDEPVKTDYYVSKKIYNYDAIVNVCKMKTHMLTGLTGAVKNMYGIIPGKIKGSYHVKYGKKLPGMILDLYNKHPPVLNIMDGIKAMEGNGPGNGRPKKVGYLLVSESGIALDRVCAEITGHSINELPVLEEARKKHKEAFLKNIELNTSLPNFSFRKALRPARRVPDIIFKSLMKYYNPWPVINSEKCIKCGRCIDICPQDAVTKGENYYINKNCVKCYCCREVCPGAIELKPTLLGRVVKSIRK